MLFRLPVMALAVAVGLVAILPRFLPIEPVWYAITVPAAALTVFHSAWFCVAAAARRLGAREEEILAALSDSGD